MITVKTKSGAVYEFKPDEQLFRRLPPPTAPKHAFDFVWTEYYMPSEDFVVGRPIRLFYGARGTLKTSAVVRVTPEEE